MRRRLELGALVALVVAGLLGGCATGEEEGSDGSGGIDALGDIPAPVADEMTRSGGCSDGRLWAADDAGALAVVVDPGPDGPPAAADLPAADVAVTVLRGDDLEASICTASAGEGSPAEEGRLEVDGCTFLLAGLVAEDGTTFGVVEGTADEGC